MRPRCSILTGGFDFSGCGDCTSCPPVERAEMSNSEPSAIVLQGIPCIGGLYISLDSNGENGSGAGPPLRTPHTGYFKGGWARPIEPEEAATCGGWTGGPSYRQAKGGDV